MFQAFTNFFSRLQPYQRSLLSGIAGFLLYGAWAYGVNFSHGPMLAMKAACVQGSYSFALTFVMTLLIEFLYQFLFNALNNYLLIIWMTILITCCIIFSASWWVNVLASTPKILETVILGYIIGGVYSIVYVFSLAQTQNADRE